MKNVSLIKFVRIRLAILKILVTRESIENIIHAFVLVDWIVVAVYFSVLPDSQLDKLQSVHNICSRLVSFLSLWSITKWVTLVIDETKIII